MGVIEAFFASYPGGDYACEERENYKLAFRRGQWRKSLLGIGPRVPDRLVSGDFAQWPLVVRVLVRPSPVTFAITVRYELYLPRRIKALHADVQASVNQHAHKELEDMTVYLAECMHLAGPPPAISPLG
jgi:hypothetical protein